MRTMQLTKWMRNTSTGRLLPSITNMLSSWHLGNKISRYNVLRLSANNKALLVMTKCHCRLWGKGSIGSNFRGLLPMSPACSQSRFLFWNKCNLEEKVMVLSPVWGKLLLSRGVIHQENNTILFFFYYYTYCLKILPGLSSITLQN